MKSKKHFPKLAKFRVHFFFVGLFLFYCLLFFPRFNFPNGVLYQGDETDYQAMALNFARGHGLLRPGALEAPEDYKFFVAEKTGSLATYLEAFVSREQDKDEWKFTRNPGWPIVLGLMYKVVGPNPIWGYRLQLIFLICAATFLPALGTLFFGKRGFWAGIPSGFVFLSLYSNLSERLLTEPLMIFSLCGLLTFVSYWKKNQSRYLSLLLGLFLAWCLLLKGGFLFLPLLFFGYALSFLFRKFSRKEAGIHAALILGGILVPLLIWSAYATSRDGSFIFLSKQGAHLILAGNNELNIVQHGGWQKNWYKHENMFYNRPEIKDRALPAKLCLFYLKFFRFIPRLFQNKIHVGFVNFDFIKIFLLFFVWRGLFLAFRKNSKFSIKSIFLLGAFPIFSLLFYFEVYSILLLFFSTGIFLALADEKSDLFFPMEIFLIFANIILITLLFFGEERFTYVMDIFFIFLCFHSGIFLLQNLGMVIKPLRRVPFFYNQKERR